MELIKNKNGFYCVKFSNGKIRSMKTKSEKEAKIIYNKLESINGDKVFELNSQTAKILKSKRKLKKRKGKRGFVYILSNPCFQYLKIGLTQLTPKYRCEELSSSTSAPLPFAIEFAVEVDNVFEIEYKIHVELKRHRVNKRKEFFNMTLSDAKKIVGKYGRIYYDGPESSENVTILRHYKNFRDYKNSISVG